MKWTACEMRSKLRCLHCGVRRMSFTFEELITVAQQYPVYIVEWFNGCLVGWLVG